MGLWPTPASLTWAVSMFRCPTDSLGSDVDHKGGFAMATRFTLLPIEQGDDSAGVPHLGAVHSFSDPANSRLGPILAAIARDGRTAKH